MKIAILTALCGNKEKLVNPSVVHSGVDYIAFVDKEWPNATVWNKKNLVSFSSDPRFSHRRNAKPYKIMPHLFAPGYDFYFWVDVSHDVVADPFDICNKYLINSDVAVFKHTDRNCVYKESEILKHLNYDHLDLIDRQIEYYKSLKYPENNGLYELPVSVRKNSEKTQILNMKWWEHICKYTSRDQLSFPVCLWETGITPNILPGYANGFNSNGSIGNNSLIPQVRQHISSGPK